MFPKGGTAPSLSLSLLQSSKVTHGICIIPGKLGAKIFKLDTLHRRIFALSQLVCSN